MSLKSQLKAMHYLGTKRNWRLRKTDLVEWTLERLEERLVGNVSTKWFWCEYWKVSLTKPEQGSE